MASLQHLVSGNKLRSNYIFIDSSNPNLVAVNASNISVYNRLQGNYHLSNKKALFLNMKAYYQSISGEELNVFNYLPVTFHIKEGLGDPEFTKFLSYYDQMEQQVTQNKNLIRELKEDGQVTKAKKMRKVRNIWIIKPGENTNRGTGIIVSDYEVINIGFERTH